ncbi:ECF RNA polymerase sigma factor SigE [Posidoniimonas polymericola]|uniref:ECF RNA polymerase sigma factor SigE n=1 Tax=Posidoniimonas polymericola TaxID=2528002 RepID=A0A5C5YED5_9BACT|nr:sigma-70 family RNA polymerase sigma factor [Posidoniimonas polymericola]TWT72831.1 ECF RNA polymerase sigma factor SigE [Posidoniimonas polymericola]
MGFLTNSQDRLRAFILASVGNYSDAGDILQKTNVVLLKKAGDYAEAGQFDAWAIGIAKYEVLAHIRDRQRERLSFSPDLVELMSDAAEEQVKKLGDRQLALRKCLSQLPAEKRQLIGMRYFEELSMAEIAARLGKSAGAVKATVRRLRGLLHECVSRKMADAKPSVNCE